MTTQPRRRIVQDDYPDDERRWRAVLDRDPNADGMFCYAVRTTGVYCRPTCRSKRPRRENVGFYPTAAAAAAAGFRACKRCRPDRAASAEDRNAAVARACRLIDEAEVAPSLAHLARLAGMSASHFHRVFTAAIGITPRAYAQARRTQRVRATLGRRVKVTDAIYQAGFNSSSRFYAEAGKILGMTPSRYRVGGAGETIRFAHGTCSLGSVLVAATARGICAISLGDAPAALQADLRMRFPRAELAPADTKFARLVRQVVALIETPERSTALPLDIRGTAFQQRVWQALNRIPVGSRMSYAELARRIGAPNAVRAVGHACAANTIAVAIPCHRAVRSDGTLAGYRWGIERKQVLLERERKAAHGDGRRAGRRVGKSETERARVDQGRRARAQCPTPPRNV